MKKGALTLIFALCVLSVFGQQPTEFREIDFATALKTAGAENKLVFLDAYTSWCGPCKMMANAIFPEPVLGSFMNEHFVNVKYDMEKGEGVDINTRYGIDAYPTFLILNPDGTLRNKIVGASASAEEFKEIVEKALSVEIDINKLMGQYESGDRSIGFMSEYIQALVATGDAPKARQIAESLLNSLSDSEKTDPALWFIYKDEDISPTGTQARSYLMSHVEDFYTTVGRSEVNEVIAPIYQNRLEDILRGRDRQTTLPQIVQLGQQIEQFDLDNNDILLSYVALLEAGRRADADKYLKICTDLLPKLSDEKLAFLYFNFGMDFKKIASAEQIAQFADLSRKIAENVQDSRVRISMNTYIESQLK